MLSFKSTPPLSLYVHLPWCERKCPYCDFNSHNIENMDESSYIKALIEDLHQDLPLIWGRQIHSIFIGGGTPSLFSPHSIHQLLSELRACLNFQPGIEISMETNPGSADEANFKGYREAGVNRLSIGVQSFNDSSLKVIGRIHNKSQAISSFEMARNVGFDNINLDLMFSLPEQDLTMAIEDISFAISLLPEHISYYQLTIEPNTFFHQHPPLNIPDDDLSWGIQLESQDLLKQHGYSQYEISAFSQKKKQCQHNLNYWQFGDYIGIGAGAHGKITLPAENRILRRTRVRDPRKYLNSKEQEKVSQQREIDQSDLIFEFMLNSLRLTNGFDSSLFSETTGMHFRHIASTVTQAVNMGLLETLDNKLKPTPLGLQFCNDLQSLFLNIEVDPCENIFPNTSF